MERDAHQLLTAAIATVPGQRVLVCPLNWGLGHATRCVPVIRALLTANKIVVLASDGFPMEFLRQEFPSLEMVNFPSMKITYSTGTSQVGAMLRAVPHFVRSIWHEHRQLRHIVAAHHINTVLSDNRFGLWTRHTYCIYMTHQLMIKMPRHLKWLERPVHWLHLSIIAHYDACWVPDWPNAPTLAGDLAHRFMLPRHARFVGPLSRFMKPENAAPSPYKVLVLLSGPEPQRSILERLMTQRLQQSLVPSLIVCGTPQPTPTRQQINNVTLVSHLDTNKLTQLIVTTPTIVCRSGYTTLMDLDVLQRTAILIATPGQTEQEYLADIARNRGFTVVKQQNL